MAEENTQKNTAENTNTEGAPEAAAPKVEATAQSSTPASTQGAAQGNAGANTAGAPGDRGGRGPRGGGGAGGGDRRRNPRRQRRGGRRDERSRPEFEQKLIGIRRVTRVMAGGRRFSFSVSMVAGDKRGKVGVGVGKAGDTQLAIEKAFRSAKKNMITVKMDKNHHLPHDVHTKYASSEISILPAPGRGLVAGSSVRTVLELAGVKDVTAKIFSRSKNKLNNARAAVKALQELK